MNCNEIQLEISALLDGDLKADEERIQSHCRRCSACREFLKEQRELMSFLRTSDPELPPPSQLWYEIRGRIETQASVDVDEAADSGNSGRDLFRIPRWVYATGAAAALVLLSFLMIDFNGSSDQERYLAELEIYTLQAPENPFLSEIQSIENPFYKVTAPQHLNNPFQSRSSLE